MATKWTLWSWRLKIFNYFGCIWKSIRSVFYEKSWFFDKAHENAIIDLNNELLQDAHLICASKELPITKEDCLKYFSCDGDKLDELVEKEDLYKNPKGKYIYPYDDSPSFHHNLDQISSETFTVMCNGKVLETMEKSYVYKEAHEGAVLINKGETYIIDSLNLKRRFVNAIKQEVDFHTCFKRYSYFYF